MSIKSLLNHHCRYMRALTRPFTITARSWRESTHCQRVQNGPAIHSSSWAMSLMQKENHRQRLSRCGVEIQSTASENCWGIRRSTSRPTSPVVSSKTQIKATESSTRCGQPTGGGRFRCVCEIDLKPETYGDTIHRNFSQLVLHLRPSSWLPTRHS